jgi:hypothetical protein
MFVLTETWINPFTISAKLLNSVHTEFPLLVFLIQLVLTIKNKITGGGTAFLVHDSFKILSSSYPSIVTFKLSESRLTAFNVYRPPPSSTKAVPSSTKAVPFSQFLIDFQNVVSLAATTYH